MPSLPRKSVKGTMFKKWVVDSIDQIIDYLSSNWLQPGNGINIRRTPSGTIIELQKQAETRQTLSGGGGANQDITSTVAGGTAFVGLTGSTASAAFVGTGAVTISGNTNTGNIEINATGGTSATSLGFPDYSSGIAVSGGTTYGGYTTDGWLIGDVTSPNSAYATGDCECIVTLNGNGFSALSIVLLNTIGLTNFQNYAGVITNPVFLPIPANVSFNINPSVVSGQDATINLRYYTCITQ